MGAFRSADAKLAPIPRFADCGLADDAPGRSINVPLLLLLGRSFNYHDSWIVEDLVGGMPISGDIHEGHVMRPRVKPASMSADERKMGIPARNKRATGRAESFRKTDLGADCRRKSLLGIRSVWTSGPVQLAEDFAGSVNLTPMYDIEEHHGNGARKVRAVDDLRTSGANAITPTHDTAVPDSLDMFLALTS